MPVVPRLEIVPNTPKVANIDNLVLIAIDIVRKGEQNFLVAFRIDVIVVLFPRFERF